MTSTGNDIVALKTINIARTKQPNFYRKILSDTEQGIYDQKFLAVMPFERFVWLLWSIKESVYKYLQRITPELIFSPTKIIITRLDAPSDDAIPILEGRDFKDKAAYKSKVAFGDYILYSRSIISNEFIFSVVNHTDNFERVFWGIREISSAEAGHQSEAVRKFAIAMLNTLFHNSILEIDKSVYGYPVLLKNNAEIPIPVSLAHHDHWVGYSFQG